MKILNITQYKTKLVKFKLLRTKIYKNQKNFNDLKLKESETRLKKILHVIYRFHIANKKILFLGTPLNPIIKIKQLIKHNFVPESVWLNGIITNPLPSFKHLLKQHAINNDKTSKFLFNLKNQTDLIVVLNEKRNITALKETALKKIPTISLNLNDTCLNMHLSTYTALGDYNFTKKKIKNNFFFLLLYSLLKKAEFVRKQILQNSKNKKRFKNVKKRQTNYNSK